MKYLTTLSILLLLFISSSFAQDNFIGSGVVINSNSTGNVQLSGVIEQPIIKALNLTTLTFADVSGITLKPFDTTHMQFTGSQAIAYYILSPTTWLRLGILGEAGLTGTLDVATGAKFGGGGVADITFSKSFTLKVIPKVTKNTLSDNQFELRIYPGIRF